MNKNLRLVAWLKGSVYINITLTMIVFVSLLSAVYEPTGLDLITSLMHHYIVPTAVLLYLFWFEKKDHMTRSHLKKWIVFPVLYLVFSFIYYGLTMDAIYPFMAIHEIGVLMYLFSLTVMIALYIVLSFGLVKIVSRK
jgi:hypothetical protein